MEIEEYIENEDEDYWGYGDAYIDGQGIRCKGKRPKAVLKDTEFSKSLLDEIDEGEFYIDEFGIKRRRKKGVTELSEIEVEEVSYVNTPAVKKTFMIVKGDGDIMEEDVIKAISEEELKTIRETIGILNKAKPTGDLKVATETLERYFKGAKPYPYPYPSRVKKSDNFYWPTAERQIYGYNQDDLSMIKDSEIGEIEKSSEENPFPSLARVFNRNIQGIEEQIEEEDIESRFI